MSSRYYPNPNEDFVILGSSPIYYREPRGFTKNSAMTSTTKHLSQHMHQPDSYYEDLRRQGNFRSLSKSLSCISGNLQKTLLKEDVENTRLLAQQPSYSQTELNEALADALNSYKPPLFYRPEWYTKPVHVSSSVRIPMSSEEVLADAFFPVTLGEAKSIELLDDIKTAKSSKKSKSKNPPKSAKSREEIKKEARRLNNLFLLASETPHIHSAGVTFTSPYSEELSKLRMEKLRIEEKQYLEMKRQAELERIRGPKPKWYAMKGPEFHYEAHKNNELLRNSQDWDDLLRYREKLLDATKRLKTTLGEYEVPVY